MKAQKERDLKVPKRSVLLFGTVVAVTISLGVWKYVIGPGLVDFMEDRIEDGSATITVTDESKYEDFRIDIPESVLKERGSHPDGRESGAK